MAATNDILTDESGDIKFESGDINWGEGTEQHQRELLSAFKGGHKHAPARGVGIVNYINDEDEENMVKMIRSEFKADGMTINSLELDEGKLKTNANY